MITAPSTFAKTNTFAAMSVAGTIRHDAFRNPDFAFRSFPTVDAMAFAATVHSMSTTQQRTNTWKKKKAILIRIRHCTELFLLIETVFLLEYARNSRNIEKERMNAKVKWHPNNDMFSFSIDVLRDVLLCQVKIRHCLQSSKLYFKQLLCNRLLQTLHKIANRKSWNKPPLSLFRQSLKYSHWIGK